MKAAFLYKPNKIIIKNVPLPQPKAGEVRIKLSKVGICGSDVHLFLGHRIVDKPTIIGHEGIGTIDKIGTGVKGRAVGERVVIEPNVPCRSCGYCLSGKSTICPNKITVGLNSPGCFAEYVTVDAEFAWKIPDGISDENAVTIEPMAVAVHSLFTSASKPGDTIAVIGLGAIGLLLTHLALALGYKVCVSEINPGKVKLATSMGAIAISSKEKQETQCNQLSQSWKSNDVSAVFECAGTARSASMAIAAAPRGSEVIMVGLSGDLANIQPLKIAREGISIVPSLIYRHPVDFKRTIQLIHAGVVNPGMIISSYTSLQRLQSALTLASQGSETKIVVNVNGR